MDTYKSGYIDCGSRFWMDLIEIFGFLKSIVCIRTDKKNDSHYIVYGNWNCICCSNRCKVVFNQIHAINRNLSFPFAIDPTECIHVYDVSFNLIPFDVQRISPALVFDFSNGIYDFPPIRMFIFHFLLKQSGVFFLFIIYESNTLG